MLVYTSTTTWNKPSGLLAVKVRCWGGGGAGGGAAATSGTQYSAGSGGGAGGYVEMWIAAADLPSSLTATVGAGGTGSSTATGGNGGDTTFDAFITASGGSGAALGGATTTTATPTPGAGGSGSGTGAPSIITGSGGLRSILVTGSYVWIGPGGQSSGGAQSGQPLINGTGITGGAPGGGGSGVARGFSQTAIAGGGGNSGRIIVEQYFQVA